MPATRALVPILARTLHAVSLSLWLGGLVAIGALVAPTAFHVTRTAPAFVSNLSLQNAVAGGVVGGSLHLFTFLCYACGLLLLLANALLLPHAIPPLGAGRAGRQRPAAVYRPLPRPLPSRPPWTPPRRAAT